MQYDSPDTLLDTLLDTLVDTLVDTLLDTLLEQSATMHSPKVTWTMMPICRESSLTRRTQGTTVERYFHCNLPVRRKGGLGTV